MYRQIGALTPRLPAEACQPSVPVALAIPVYLIVNQKTTIHLSTDVEGEATSVNIMSAQDDGIHHAFRTTPADSGGSKGLIHILGDGRTGSIWSDRKLPCSRGHPGLQLSLHCITIVNKLEPTCHYLDGPSLSLTR